MNYEKKHLYNNVIIALNINDDLSVIIFLAKKNIQLRGRDMNWIMNFIFLIFILYIYQLFGNIVLKFFKYKNTTKSKEIIAGSMLTTFIQWIIGFPCQFFHLSWNVYFYALLVSYVIIIFITISYYKKNKIKVEFNMLEHLKTYWFIYGLAIAFSIFSMTNQLAYFEMNYDDSYYLGAIAQNINANNIASSNYFTGAPSNVDIARLLNTFEIGYGFWATLFNIDFVFFARATMVLHNYFILFLASHALLSCWCRNKYYTQYALIGYAILLIPSGYLEQVGLMKMYDAWQLNTAIWYGSSFVRIGSLPILLTFGFDILKKFDLKKCFFIFIIFCTMISYSSIFTIYASLFLLSMSTLFCVIRIRTGIKKKERIFWIIIILVIWFLVLCSSVIYSNIYENFNGDISESKKVYYIWRTDVFNIHNPLLILSLAISFIGLKKVKSKKYYIAFSFAALCLIIFKVRLFDNFVLLSCMDVSFAALRMTTSLQLLLVLFAGYTIIVYTGFISKYSYYSFIMLLAVCVVIMYNIFHIDLYKNINWAGSGLSSYGFSLERLISNDQMGPILYKDIGDYFNSLPNRKYRIAGPYQVSYEGGKLNLFAGLNYSSHNIEVCTTGASNCDGIGQNEKNKLVDFVTGLLNREDVDDILNKYKINYILLDNEDVKNKLLVEGCNLVKTSISSSLEEFYLLELN